MKSTLIILTLVVSTFANAGVNLLIEHPRHPNQQKDKYTVDCDKKCALEIVAMNPEKGKASDQMEIKVKELWSLVIPKAVPLRENRVLYKVSAVDGDKKIEFKVGYPENYEGEELAKYMGVINYIETLKRTMRSELEAGKK